LAAFLKERITMRATFTVHHNEHISSRSFEEVVSAFESAVGSVEDIGFPALLALTKSAEEFEASVQSRADSSGFMRFLTVDHGPWMARIGLKAKANCLCAVLPTRRFFTAAIRYIVQRCCPLGCYTNGRGLGVAAATFT
jgi:hypothetical protein